MRLLSLKRVSSLEVCLFFFIDFFIAISQEEILFLKEKIKTLGKITTHFSISNYKLFRGKKQTFWINWTSCTWAGWRAYSSSIGIGKRERWTTVNRAFYVTFCWFFELIEKTSQLLIKEEKARLIESQHLSSESYAKSEIYRLEVK